MMYLTFGEMVKVVLGRKGITIKELAVMIEGKTGKKMSRQNLTQRLSRDNFQEQDMRMIAEVLGCSLQLNLIQPGTAFEEDPDEIKLTRREKERLENKRIRALERKVDKDHAGREKEGTWYQKNSGRDQERERYQEQLTAAHVNHIVIDEKEREITAGELASIQKELSSLDGMNKKVSNEELLEILNKEIETTRNANPANNDSKYIKQLAITKVFKQYVGMCNPEASQDESTGSMMNEQPVMDEADFWKKQEANKKRAGAEPIDPSTLSEHSINPYTNKEYETNSVRTHPSRIGYVQVYDRSEHRWTDMTEWAFLGYQERKKTMLGKAYEPPIYLD